MRISGTNPDNSAVTLLKQKFTFRRQPRRKAVNFALPLNNFDLSAMQGGRGLPALQKRAQIPGREPPRIISLKPMEKPLQNLPVGMTTSGFNIQRRGSFP